MNFSCLSEKHIAALATAYDGHVIPDVGLVDWNREAVGRALQDANRISYYYATGEAVGLGEFFWMNHIGDDKIARLTPLEIVKLCLAYLDNIVPTGNPMYSDARIIVETIMRQQINKLPGYTEAEYVLS